MAVAHRPRELETPALKPVIMAPERAAAEVTPPLRPWLRWLTHVVLLLALAAVLLTLA